MEQPTTIRRPPTSRGRQQEIAELRELIAALDARVSRLERPGEADIARDAAALRREALQRIADLRRPAADD